jgi:hypothetical protein
MEKTSPSIPIKEGREFQKKRKKEGRASQSPFSLPCCHVGMVYIKVRAINMFYKF